VGDVGDDDCGGCFIGLPFKLGEAAVASGDVITAVQNCSRNL